MGLCVCAPVVVPVWVVFVPSAPTRYTAASPAATTAAAANKVRFILSPFVDMLRRAASPRGTPAAGCLQCSTEPVKIKPGNGTFPPCGTPFGHVRGNIRPHIKTGTRKRCGPFSPQYPGTGTARRGNSGTCTRAPRPFPDSPGSAGPSRRRTAGRSRSGAPPCRRSSRAVSS